VSDTTEQESSGPEPFLPADSHTAKERQPKTSALDSEAEGTAGDKEDEDRGELGGSESRGHDGRVVTRTVQAKNSFSDSYIRVEVDFVIGERARGDVSVPVADVTRSATSARETFVEPSYLHTLKQALTKKPNVVILAGAACGKWTAATVALQAVGHEPILQLPSDMAVRNLAETWRPGASLERVDQWPRSVRDPSLSSS
jgi:hypothetical protein